MPSLDFPQGVRGSMNGRSVSPLRAAILSIIAGAFGVSSAPLLAQEDAEPRPIDEITVLGRKGSQVALPDPYAGGQVARGGRAGLFGNLDMMDSPFSSTNFTAELIRDQQARGVGDVLQNDPVVRVARGFGNFQELYFIRGFPTFSDDMTYNGIFGILPRQFVAAEFLERVEVFRGANAFINGAAPGGSSIGGAVNLVPKRAPDEPLTRVTTGFENRGHGYVALDVGRRFGMGNSTGIRVNALRRDGETSIRDQERELTVFSFGLDHSGEQFRVSADIGYQDHHIDSPRPSVTPLGGIPRPPDASSNFAQPWTFTDEQQLFGVVRGEYDLTPNTSIWAAIGGRSGEEANVLSNPNAQPNGETTAFRFDNAREDTIFSTDFGARTEFSTGRVGHRVIVSGSFFSSEFKNAFALSDFAGFPGNLYDPTPVPPPTPDAFVGGDLSAPLVTFKTDTSSAAIADMLSFADGNVLLTLGLRFQSIETESFDFNTGESQSGYDESRVTPIVGLVVRRGEHLSFYGNYAEGLIPGDVAPTLSGGEPVENAGETFSPYQAEQYEVGVKYDGGDFGATASVFELTRPSAFVEDNVFTAAGEQRNRGLELSVFGQPLETVRVIGGLTLLDAELTRTQNRQFDGNEAIGVPDTRVNLNVEWDVPAVQNLTLDTRAVYTSSVYADAANTMTVPSWTRFDIGARYSTRLTGREVTLRGRVDNVTDSNDWVSVGGFPGANYLVLGNPRTFSLSLSVDF
jgi:iron complex outermembrane recepter protein